MTLIEPIQIVDTHIIPLTYGDLFINVNVRDEPILVNYFRTWSMTEYSFSSSCRTIDDVVNEFIEPIPDDNNFSTNYRTIIHHTEHTIETIDGQYAGIISTRMNYNESNVDHLQRTNTNYDADLNNSQ